MQIFRDHMIFFQLTLAEKEDVILNTVNEVLSTIIAMSGIIVDEGINETNLGEINQIREEIREIKEEILRRQLENTIKINLPPTFVNHMINQLEEFDKVLYSISLIGQLPILSLSELFAEQYIWLVDTTRHTETIYNRLDLSEEKNIKNNPSSSENYLKNSP